jgi:hypothetical protein
MKSKRKSVITLLFVLFAFIFFSQCKKVIFQTDKPLYDVIVDKTWENVENPDNGRVKYCSNEKVVFKNECPIQDTGDSSMFSWILNNDTIITTQEIIVHGNIKIDTVDYMYIEKYSEKKISGTYYFVATNDKGEFTIKVCD